jgi:hypothetical protein
MPVFCSRRGSQYRTFLNLAGSVVVVALTVFALTLFGARRNAFAADEADASASIDADSASADSTAPPTLIPDARWEEANQVLELPQECNPELATMPCDQRPSSVADSSSSSDDDDDEDVETAGIKSAPGLDAENGGGGALAMQPMDGVEEYENQPMEEAPILASAWIAAPAYVANTNNAPRMALMAARSPWHFGGSPMSGPLTQAATPPLGYGYSPWATSPMTTWNRPAGGPMIMPGMSFRMR